MIIDLAFNGSGVYSDPGIYFLVFICPGIVNGMMNRLHGFATRLSYMVVSL